MTETLTENEQNDADRQAVAEVVQKAKIATVTTVDADGSLVSRPLAVQDRDFDGDIYFFVPDPSNKTEQVRANDQVNLAIETDGNYLSIAGTATITKDRAMIDELWNAAAAAWFEDGKEDPSVALLKVHADSAELQSLDTPKAIALVKYAKAIVTGDTPDVGDSTRVDL